MLSQEIFPDFYVILEQILQNTANLKELYLGISMNVELTNYIVYG